MSVRSRGTAVRARAAAGVLVGCLALAVACGDTLPPPERAEPGAEGGVTPAPADVPLVSSSRRLRFAPRGESLPLVYELPDGLAHVDRLERSELFYRDALWSNVGALHGARTIGAVSGTGSMGIAEGVSRRRVGVRRVSRR